MPHGSLRSSSLPLDHTRLHRYITHPSCPASLPRVREWRMRAPLRTPMLVLRLENKAPGHGQKVPHSLGDTKGPPDVSDSPLRLLPYPCCIHVRHLQLSAGKTLEATVPVSTGSALQGGLTRLELVERSGASAWEGMLKLERAWCKLFSGTCEKTASYSSPAWNQEPSGQWYVTGKREVIILLAPHCKKRCALDA